MGIVMRAPDKASARESGDAVVHIKGELSPNTKTC